MAKNYHLGNVKPHVKAAAEEVGEKFDYSTIGGWRAVGSVPNSDHPKGLAIDLMTLSKTKGDATVAYLIANASRLGITYIIYWRQIWHPGKGWSDYDGPSAHTNHVHVSFSEKAGDGSVPKAPDESAPGGSLNPANWPIIGQIEGLATTLQSRDFWLRVGFYLMGLGLIGAGLLFLFRKPIQEVVVGAATKKVGA